MAEDEVQVPIVWVDVDQTPIQFANQFVSQFQSNEFIVTIGQLAPPMILGPPEERAEQFQNLAFVTVRPLARFGLPASRLRELIQVLSENLEGYERQFGGQ
ncbi:MAG: hypothetical protein ACRDZO_20950 [Egibacteraceae bacterium]